MQVLQVTVGSKGLDAIVGREENLSLADGHIEGNGVFTVEIVLLDVAIDEDSRLLSDLVDIAQVLLLVSVRLREAKLALDLIRDERKALSTIVLNSARGRNVQVVTDVFRAIGQETKSNDKCQHSVYSRDGNRLALGYLRSTSGFGLDDGTDRLQLVESLLHI